MSSKEKGLREALKDMFKRNKGNSGNLSTRGDSLCLNEELLKDLSKESPIASRVKILKEYSSRVKESKLENTALEKLWNAIEDLFGPDHATETRHVAFAFLQSLLRGQYDKLKLMRAHFFRFIKHHDHPEDVGQRLDSLNILTCNGKNILYFEEEVGPFLLQWLPDISKAGKIEEYLSMVDNVVKFNAAYLDDEVISGFIQHMCILCCSTGNSKTVVESCLQIMSTIVAYSNMPPESLPKFIGTLCRTVNVEDYCMLSWKIMKNLLGTHMGHSTLYTMCRILQEPALSSDSDLLRGAVFYIHMALWGSIPVTNLHCPPSSVLPSFLHAIKCNQASVAFEVVLGLQHLVHRHGQELQNPAWSVLLQIILHIIHHFDLSSNQPPNKEIKVCLRETLNNIENLMEIGSYNGSVEQFFRIIEECSADQPESSILRLIMYYSQSIVPTEHLWLTNLYNLLHKYFKPEIRTNIRLKVLDILANVIKLNRRQYEDELIERIVLPHTVNVVNCNDVIVRSSVANLLIDLALECESKKCVELLDILERLLLRPFDSHMQDIPPNTEIEHYDIQCLVEGLIKVFIYKIHKLPSIQAIKIYKMLVTFLECHYKQPKVFENCPVIRRMIFDCFLKMRADSLYHLGYDNGEKIEYSHYLCVVYHNPDRGSLGSPVPQSPAPTQNLPVSVTHVSLRRAFKVFLSCLKFEKDWEVLSLVLKEMTKGLQNKSLILSKQGNNELDLLVDVLCAMITDKSYNLPESLNMKVSKPNFHALVILVLVNLASYHNYLDQSHQQKMIRCLMKCTNSIGPKSSKHCIAALTICTLEMREAMVKLLPEVLLNLSKISATVHIAIPVLEFISTLAQLPMVYSSFVADQYMAVFAISLPYTNPFRYDHYTVSLAHHVIAVWFLKCRLPFRKDFVKFITNGLQTNVLIPFEETKPTIFNQNLSELNQDSSDRKRSSSLTEQGSRRRTANVSAVRMDKAVLKKSSPEKSLMTFYEELTETCIDLMARYAFSPCSALPRRLPVAEFLLNGGQSMCWLIGNKLFTVTTSGCSQKILKNGLCDKCWTLCSNQNESRKKTGRSGSNETDDLDWASRQNSNEKSNNTSVSSPSEDLRKIGDKLDMVSSKLQQIASSVKQEKEMCACWCSGWAEIYVRRPTGDMSWVMRIQNQISFTHSIYDFPLNELSTLFMPSLYPETSPSLRPPLRRQFSEDQVNQDEDKGSLAAMGSNSSLPGSPKQAPSRQNSHESVEEDLDCLYDDGSRSRNPVRRSNSSPEMSASWKNPFLHQKLMMDDDCKSSDDDGGKKNKMYSKDMRVSCEAIPEEIAGSGTTPPSNDPLQVEKTAQTSKNLLNSSYHPTLLSCHSYPGSSPPKETNIAPKPYQTVPPTPNVSTFSGQQPDFMKRPTNLPNLSSLVPLSSKPPQSPTQTSPRLGRHLLSRDGREIQKSSSSSILEKNTSNVNLNLARERARERKNSGSMERLSSLEPNLMQKRDRVHTISVMSPVTRKPRSETFRSHTKSKEVPKSGINPSFVFLQLYHQASFGSKSERPILVENNDIALRAVKVLDSIAPYETHKIGVVYVREGQTNSEVEIYKNRFGSLRYVEFLQQLGTLVKLEDVDPQVFFLGGLDQHGNDGKFAYIWQDDVIRVMFHVATMMPNKESDPFCNNKKMHIGNNYVTIVYNDSKEDFNISTIKGQFTFVCIVIHPLDHGINSCCQSQRDYPTWLPVSEPKLVSDQNVAILARQLALHANLASLVARSLKNHSSDPYASNWLERLRKIKNIRNKVMQDRKNEENIQQAEEGKGNKQMEDFTDYT
uniref:TSC2 n=1 Tax=Leptinotarsa decemlineata TaxID=7539 RepID=A0A0M4M1C4_LEPDE|nr:TSC2 [Leptinotarsa decemlineata]